MALEVTDQNLETVLNSELVVLDFWAPWCGPCRMLTPIIEELSNSNSDVIIGKLNIDENREAALKYGVRSIPTVIFIKNGEVVDKVVGANPKSTYQNKIDELKS